MNQALIDEVTRRLTEYPLYSQEEKPNHLIVVKLFNAFGAGNWYLSEYDPKEDRAFGYVTGLGGDEWGYICIGELASVFLGGSEVPLIEVDLHFKPAPFSELKLK